jgi:hypothetical protein
MALAPKGFRGLLMGGHKQYLDRFLTLSIPEHGVGSLDFIKL